MPRHKYWTRTATFTAEGPSEFKQILDLMEALIIGNDKPADDDRRQVFEEPPNFGMDNHFSGDMVVKELGERGFKQ